MSGLWGGIGLGVAVAALGLAALSLAGPQPAGNRPPDAPEVRAPDAPEAVADESEGPSAPGPLPRGAAPGEARPVAEGGPAPVAARPEADAPSVDPTPGEMPVAGAPSYDLSGPATDDRGPEAAPRIEAPPLPRPLASSPSLPGLEDDPAIATTPAVVPEAAGMASPLGEPTVGEVGPAEAPGAEAVILPNPQAAALRDPVREEDLTVATAPSRPTTPVEVFVVPDAVAVEVVPDPVPPAAPAPEEAPVPTASTRAPDPSDADGAPDAAMADASSEPAPGTAAMPPDAPLAVAADDLAMERPAVSPDPLRDAGGLAPEAPGEEAAPESMAATVPPEVPAAPLAPDVALAELEQAPVGPSDLGDPDGAVGVREAPSAVPATDTPAAPDLAPAAGVPAEPPSPGADSEPDRAGVAEPIPEPIPEAAPARPAAPAGPGRISLQGGGLPGAGGAVRVNRPEPEPATPEPSELAERPPEAAALPDDAPALLRFATPFEGAAERPLLGVVLLDDGSLPGAIDVVDTLPMPVSVALDPSIPGATEAMTAYRARGIEVLALIELPTGAQPVDAAVSYEAILAILPEAVGVLDMGLGGLEGESAVADQALARLAEDGLGAVLAAGGLGSSVRQAVAAGVPAAALRRDLDGEGQDAGTIRRFLDDAARRAGQDGAAVVLARARPDTLSALALWGEGRRAQEVALAPVSALLGPPGAAE